MPPVRCESEKKMSKWDSFASYSVFEYKSNGSEGIRYWICQKRVISFLSLHVGSVFSDLEMRAGFIAVSFFFIFFFLVFMFLCLSLIWHFKFYKSILNIIATVLWIAISLVPIFSLEWIKWLGEKLHWEE